MGYFYRDNDEILEHKDHKYISRTWKNGRWNYVYDVPTRRGHRAEDLRDARDSAASIARSHKAISNFQRDAEASNRRTQRSSEYMRDWNNDNAKDSESFWGKSTWLSEKDRESAREWQERANASRSAANGWRGARLSTERKYAEAKRTAEAITELYQSTTLSGRAEKAFQKTIEAGSRALSDALNKITKGRVQVDQPVISSKVRNRGVGKGRV